MYCTSSYPGYDHIAHSQVWNLWMMFTVSAIPHLVKGFQRVLKQLNLPISISRFTLYIQTLAAACCKPATPLT